MLVGNLEDIGMYKEENVNYWFIGKNDVYLMYLLLYFFFYILDYKFYGGRD